MASITWPPSLPLPVREAYSESPPSSVVRWAPDVGPALTRRRSTAGIRSLSLTYVLDTTDFATFEAFYLTTSLGGALEFNFTHPRDLSTVEARFASVRYSSREMDTNVFIELEVLP